MNTIAFAHTQSSPPPRKTHHPSPSSKAPNLIAVTVAVQQARRGGVFTNTYMMTGRGFKVRPRRTLPFQSRNAFLSATDIFIENVLRGAFERGADGTTVSVASQEGVATSAKSPSGFLNALAAPLFCLPTRQQEKILR